MIVIRKSVLPPTQPVLTTKTSSDDQVTTAVVFRGLSKKKRKRKGITKQGTTKPILKQVSPPSKTPVKKMKRRILKIVKEPRKMHFGFATTQLIETVIQDPGNLPSEIFSLSQTIVGFRLNRPVYENCDEKKSTIGHSGLYMPITSEFWPICLSQFHTPHTESLFELAHLLLIRLWSQPKVLLQSSDHEINNFKTVYIGKSSSPGGKTAVLMDCQHMGEVVVVKRARDRTEQLRMALEALIHLQIGHSHPKLVPKLHFIGFTPGRTLVLCSQQLKSLSVYTFMVKRVTIGNYQHKQSQMLQTMATKVCAAFIKVQKAKFTHRDCHTSNVYYNCETNAVTFIDFDWSAIVHSGQILSVPRYLYDTTRDCYGSNKSVDCCIFFRSLVDSMLGIRKLTRLPFFKVTLAAIMTNYQDECSQMLNKEYTDEKNKMAAIQLYQMSTQDETIQGKYKHRFGIQRLNDDKVEFEYRMGYFEWKSMRPENIMQFLETGYFLEGSDFRKK